MTHLLKKDLTNQELGFIARHGIDLIEIFDGRKFATWFWKKKAKENNCSFVLASECNNGAHRLKSRSGHCIQCKPANISFTKRENSVGNVYLASASEGEIVKVGSASSVYDREETLNKQGYGGYKDWEIICSIKVRNAGKVERDISSLFSKNHKYANYLKGENSRVSIEMFEVEEVKASKKFSAWVKSEIKTNITWHSTRKIFNQKS